MRLRNFSLLFLVGLFVIATQATASAASWKFIVAGDSRAAGNGEPARPNMDVNGVNTTILGEIAAQTVSQGAEFIMMPGDLTTNGTQTQLETWRTTMMPVYNAGIKVLPIRGNHDNSRTSWNNVFKDDSAVSGKDYRLPQDGPSGEVNRTWSYVFGSGTGRAMALGMDMYDPNDHTVNQTWVDNKLAWAKSQGIKHIFAMGHEPAFKNSHGDGMFSNPSGRNTFVTNLVNAGVRSYFCGHDHFYDHLRTDDVEW